MAVVVLDASVLIALLDGEDPHHARAVQAVGSASEHRRVIPATAYAEALVGPQRRGGAAGETLDKAIADRALDVVDVDRDIARRAAELRARHASLRLPDALVLATADALEAERVLTADRSWSRYGKRVRVI